MSGKSKANLVPTAFLKQAGSGKSIRVYRDNEIIYLQGDPADALFYVQSGMIKLTVASKRGRKKAVLAVLQEGDFFGEGCLGIQLRRMYTATSMGASTITRFGKVPFLGKLARDPEFAAMFTQYLLSQIARFEADLADHFFNFSERRLARILLMHGTLTQQSESGTSSLRLSQTTLAQMVGTTRGRVSSFMKEFREKGLIRYNGGLEIDSARLSAFLEG